MVSGITKPPNLKLFWSVEGQDKTQTALYKGFKRYNCAASRHTGKYTYAISTRYQLK